MKILDVPTSSVSEVKKNPGKIFQLAEDEGTGVYVFNRNTVAGVMLTQDQYDSLNQRIDLLEEQLLDYEVAERLNQDDVQTFSDEEVRGDIALSDNSIDVHDGWE